MNDKYIVITDNKFSEPMSKNEAIKLVKDYDNQGIVGYIVSEEESKRIKKPSNFNEPKWE
ncbi:hypothetical protein [Schnuerera sp.]|uniref:hypothetical protein n=1 Tax=Schnuerera sp. TaxID=2794844 RepID=UPI002CF505B2|nr:hypothetical protein [Schnuerera sp.]HSH36681.1 hypothetical protein [Schnuerera sp.]